MYAQVEYRPAYVFIRRLRLRRDKICGNCYNSVTAMYQRRKYLLKIGLRKKPINFNISTLQILFGEYTDHSLNNQIQTSRLTKV